MKIVMHHDSRILQILDNVVSQVHDSRASQVHDSGASRIPAFRLLQPPNSRISRQSYILKRAKSSNTKAKFGHYFHTCSKTRETFKIHQDFFMITPFHKTEPYFHYWLANLVSWILTIRRFEGVSVLPNSPTLAPRGSGLTPTIRFHKTFQILVKNVTLGTSE
jgi:hypothetical protein